VLSRRGDRDRSEALVLAADAGRLAEERGMAPLRAGADALAASLRHTPRAVVPTQLTRRQNEIAGLLARGLTERQIADVLSTNISPHWATISGPAHASSPNAPEQCDIDRPLERRLTLMAARPLCDLL
jgi:hypothetical protein